MRFWLGGYGADMGGEAAGIGELRAGEVIDHLAGGPLAFAGTAAAASSPSWLSAHPRLDVVYAALEGQGAVQAFRRTSERGFARLGDPVPAGDLVCHVAVDPDGTRLIASCWGDGRVVAMGLDAAGRPHTPEIAASAGDPFSSGDPFAVAGDSVGRAPAHPTVDAIDLAAAARALREAAGAEFAHLVPDYAEPEASRAPTMRPSCRADSSPPPTWASTWCGSGDRRGRGCVRSERSCSPGAAGRGTRSGTRAVTCTSSPS
jgi:hypothetical protein